MIDLSKLKIKKTNELSWEITVEKEIKLPKYLDGSKVISEKVEFVYYKDKKGNYWLANCNVPEEYQKQGIGRMMIKSAIEEYGQVYFSNADRLDFNIRYPNHGYDSRYLTEQGEAMVKSLIRMKDIPSEWFRFPEI
ncbi:GNAT family N-acetyltransferase [Flavobacterium macacae]|uniref:N-acetyltransferase n=1 Tax=Flavobacterium macacae TaxID=2488993 RepID=A0A3P3W6H4_9FLAO|nr:GNAT family N-acetyltransferase [Flavobacterium macacae]RRJ90752.1 N-acetyltransferase [Flavobacterium macacae]